jgi:hypothetical protein
LAILTTDIHYRFSGTSGTGTANGSLGGAKASNQMTTDTSQNIFDNVTGTESQAGDIEYRCFFVHNAHATLTLVNAQIWFVSNTTSGDDTVDMALGNVAVGTSSEQTIANESTAPSSPSLTFSNPTSGSPLTIGNIPPGEHKGIWLRRTVNAGAAAFTNNQFSWIVEGETAG